MLNISELESVHLGNVMFISSLVFLYYDHLLTLDSEIRFLWKRPKNAGGYLFFIHRYFNFFGNMVAAFALFSTSLTISSCRSFELYHQVFQVVTQGIITAIFALRVYALYDRRRTIIAIFMSIAILGTATSIGLSIFNRNLSTPPDQGCHILFSSQNTAQMAIGWEGLLVVDTIMFALTVYKACRVHLQIGTIRIGRSLFSVVVRDGSIYFLAIALFNLANIISLYIPGPLQGNLSAFVGCLSVALLSRMMINLHEATDTGIYTDHTQTQSTMC